MDAINNVDLDTLKDYLRMLNMFDTYDYYLQTYGKNDSITSIKNYFNTHIFISIRDFHEGNYDRLHNTRADLMRYIQQNPDRKAYKNIVKHERRYKIFLRLLR